MKQSVSLVHEKDFDLQLTESGKAPLELMSGYCQALGGGTRQTDVQRYFENLLVSKLFDSACDKALLKDFGLGGLDTRAFADCCASLDVDFIPAERLIGGFEYLREVIKQRTSVYAEYLLKMTEESLCSDNPNPTADELEACAIKVARAMVLTEILKGI